MPEAGANVVIVGSSEKGEAAARRFQDRGLPCLFAQADLSKRDQIKRLRLISQPLITGFYGALDKVFEKGGLREKISTWL